LITRESDCVCCGFPCDGDKCPHRNIIIYTCDRCNMEVDELYRFNGEQVCLACIEDMTEIKNQNEILACEKCGDTYCELYYATEDGIFCDDCLKDTLEKVEVE